MPKFALLPTCVDSRAQLNFKVEQKVHYEFMKLTQAVNFKKLQIGTTLMWRVLWSLTLGSIKTKRLTAPLLASKCSQTVVLAPNVGYRHSHDRGIHHHHPVNVGTIIGCFQWIGHFYSCKTVTVMAGAASIVIRDSLSEVDFKIK